MKAGLKQKLLHEGTLENVHKSLFFRAEKMLGRVLSRTEILYQMSAYHGCMCTSTSTAINFLYFLYHLYYPCLHPGSDL